MYLEVLQPRILEHLQPHRFADEVVIRMQENELACGDRDVHELLEFPGCGNIQTLPLQDEGLHDALITKKYGTIGYYHPFRKTSFCEHFLTAVAYFTPDFSPEFACLD